MNNEVEFKGPLVGMRPDTGCTDNRFYINLVHSRLLYKF